jgi:hypothetical protein
MYTIYSLSFSSCKRQILWADTSFVSSHTNEPSFDIATC